MGERSLGRQLIEWPLAGAGEQFLRLIGVHPGAERIDKGSDSPVYRAGWGPVDVAVQVFLNPSINLGRIKYLRYWTGIARKKLTGRPVSYVSRGSVIKISFDSDPDPWHWRVPPVLGVGLTFWEGQIRPFTVKEFIGFPSLMDRFGHNDGRSRLVCRQATWIIGNFSFQSLTLPANAIGPENVCLDSIRRQLVVRKPYRKLRE